MTGLTDELHTAIQSGGAFPRLSPIARRFLDLGLMTEGSDREFLNLLVSDPALAARIVGMGNSDQGCKTMRCSVEEVAAMAGMSRVKAMASVMALTDDMVIRETTRFSLGDFWFHSCELALGMRILAYMMPLNMRPSQERIFFTGLVHHIGYLALAHCAPNQFAELLFHGEKMKARDSVSLEQEMLGIDHAMVGALLARQWGVPMDIVAAVEGHHDSELPESDVELTVLTRLAEKMMRIRKSRRDNLFSECSITARETRAIGLDYCKLVLGADFLEAQKDQVTMLAVCMLTKPKIDLR